MATPKFNSFITNINDSEVDEISDKEFKTMTIRMTNKIKEDMDMNKCLNEFQESLNKGLNEIKKTMQDMKEEFNKERNSEKKNHIKILEAKSLISQIKLSVEILSSRLKQIDDRISGLEDKTDVLEHEEEEEKN
jgi:arginine utilization protein RocB